MRAMSSTLVAAQKAASGLPYVKARLTDAWGDRPRFRFRRYYEGAETEYYSAVCGAQGGALVRAWIVAASKELLTKRIASPGAGSDFASGATSHGTVGSTSAVALCADPASNTVRLFYGVGGALKVKTSTDGGATWGSAVDVTTSGGTKELVAAAFRPSGGGVVVFWTEALDSNVYWSRWNGVSWSARTAWTHTVAAVTGLAVAHGGDFGLLVCGTAAGSNRETVWGTGFGDGFVLSTNAWGPLVVVTEAEAATGLFFLSAALVVAAAHWYGWFVERDFGSPVWIRQQTTTLDAADLPQQELWREPWPWGLSSHYGVSAATVHLGGSMWLSAANGVWEGKPEPALELDDLVLEARVDLGEHAGRAEVVVAAAGEERAALLASRGRRLELQAGYRTSAGNEVPTTGDAAYWVESAELVTGVEARVLLRCFDAWGLLETWRARRTFRWAAGQRSVLQLLRFVCARAGLRYTTTGSSSAELTSLQPALTIQPGESGRTVVRRLLGMVEDKPRCWGGRLVTEHAVGETVVYELGGAGGQALLEARYREVGPRWNRVRVVGAPGVYREEEDQSDIDGSWERGLQVVDVNLTASQAAARAARELRAAELAELRERVVVAGVVSGLELWDVVGVTDAQAGYVTAPRRVLELGWELWRRGSMGRWRMTLGLGRA